jgi:hypothetical protein
MIGGLRIAVFSARRPGAPRSPLLERLAETLDARQFTREDRVNCDLAIQWGWKGTNSTVYCVDNKIPVLVLERAQIRPDGRKIEPNDPEMFKYFSVGFNGFGGLAYVPEPGQGERWKPKLAPWRIGGEHIAVIGQLRADKALRGLNFQDWTDAQTNAARMHFPDHNVFVRPHPFELEADDRAMLAPIRETSLHTAAFIAYTSNAATDYIVNGVPGITGHDGSPAREVTSHDISRGLIYPDREKWLHRLSWRNWGDHELVDMINWATTGYEEARFRAEQGQYDDEGRFY